VIDDERCERSAQPGHLITGGGRGIGAAAALRLAQRGHDLVVNYRSDHDAATSIVQRAVAAGVRAVAVQADVTAEDDVERLFATAQDTLGTSRGWSTTPGRRCTSAS
jgi:NAD(P)-dependent dehydrogenase (short-subunit alcohol dehydrogenase family)